MCYILQTLRWNRKDSLWWIQGMFGVDVIDLNTTVLMSNCNRSDYERNGR